MCVGGGGIIRQNMTNMLQDTGDLGTGGTFPERQTKDAHRPRARRHAHQPRSPLFPALSRPTALPSPVPNTHLSGQPQDLPIMEGTYICQPGARSLCLPLPVCAYLLVPRPPGPLGQPTTPTSREFLQLGHSSLSSRSAPPGDPHLNVQRSPTQTLQAS